MTKLGYELDAPIQLNTGSQDRPTVPVQVVGEEALLASFIESESPELVNYERIKQQYQEAGASQIVEGIRERAARERNREAINAELAKQADGQQTVDETEAILAQTPAATEDDIKDLHREVARASLMRQQATTPEEKILAEHKWQELVAAGKIAPEQAISIRLNHIISELDPSAESQLGGMVADMVPFVSTMQFKRAFNTAFPDRELGFLELPRGEMALAFREEMMKLDPETRYRTAVDFMEAVLSDTGVLSGTEFQNLMILQEALDPSGFQEGFVGVNWDRVIGNTISVLDVAFMGGLARTMMRTGKRMLKPGSTLSTLNIVDQDAAAGAIAQGIKRDMSDAYRMTPAEITEQVVTLAPWKQNVELLPPDIVKQYIRAEDTTKNLLARTVGNTQAFRTAETQEALRTFRAQVAQVNNAGIYGSNYTAQLTDTGIEYTATYGRINSDGKTVMFNTPREAVEHAAEQFPTAKGVSVQQRLADGTLSKPLKVTKDGFKSSKRIGEFVYTIEDHVPFAHVQSLANKLFFEPQDVVKHGWAAKYFFDPASRFAEWISRSYAQAGDFGRGVQHQINTIVEPFTRLKKSQQGQVMHLLKEYQKSPSSFDTAALVRAADGDEGVVRGFIAYRQADEALYQLENRALRDDLLRQDAKHIVAGDYQGVGTKVGSGSLFELADKAGKKGIDVWNPNTGAMQSMDARALNRYLGKGNSLYRVKEPMGAAGKQSDLVMVTDAQQVRSLPAQVLNKIEGHIARYYKDVYFIRREVKGTMNGISGKSSFQVMGVAKNKAEANTMVRRYVQEGKLTPDEAKSAIKHDRSMNPEERATIDLQDKISLGRMFYHSRAKNLPDGIEGLADTADPIESLVKNIDSTSRHVAEADLLASMKNRWMNTYGHLTPNKQFPMNKKEIDGMSFPDDATRSKAREHFDQITMTESINTREGEIWRDSLMSLVDGLVGDAPMRSVRGVLGTAAGAPFRVLADHSINRIVRSLAFWHLIAGNPFRQIYVQSQQFLFLSAMNPTLAPKIIFKDGPAAMLGFLAKDTNPKLYKNMKPIWAKTLGMSTKEYDEFMDGFVRTGIPHSVDSHDYVANTLANYSKNIQGGMVRRTGRAIWNAANTPLRWAKKAGFDVGELSNLTNTFMLARARYLKGTGKKQLKTRKDFETVAANARNMALDMTRTGALRYQEGAFAALTQFLSIQHKAFLAMVPFGKFGNQSFTKAERARIALGQMVLNGATGLGLYELYRNGRDHLGLDIPDEAEDYIVGGLYETLINEAIAAATGEEEQDFNIAGNIAPFSGVNAANVIDVMMGHKPLIEIMAATNVINRYTEAGKTLKAMWDYPELVGDDQLTDMISAFGTVTSGWNQYIRGKAAMRLGVHVSNKGSPTVQSTYMSAMMEGALGLQLRTVDEYYALMDEYSNEYSSTDVPWDSDKEIQQVADAIYAQSVRITTLFNDELDFNDLPGDDAFKMADIQLQRMQEALKTHLSVLSLYDAIDRDRIWQRVQEKASRDRVQGRRGLIDNILKMIQRGDISAHKAEYAINRLRNSGLYDERTVEGQTIEQNIKLLMENMTMQRAHSEENLKRLEKEFNGKD